MTSSFMSSYFLIVIFSLMIYKSSWCIYCISQTLNINSNWIYIYIYINCHTCYSSFSISLCFSALSFAIWKAQLLCVFKLSIFSCFLNWHLYLEIEEVGPASKFCYFYGSSVVWEKECGLRSKRTWICPEQPSCGTQLQCCVTLSTLLNLNQFPHLQNEEN